MSSLGVKSASVRPTRLAFLLGLVTGGSTGSDGRPMASVDDVVLVPARAGDAAQRA